MNEEPMGLLFAGLAGGMIALVICGVIEVCGGFY